MWCGALRLVTRRVDVLAGKNVFFKSHPSPTKEFDTVTRTPSYSSMLFYSPDFAYLIVVHTILSKSESLSSLSVTEQRVAARTTSINADA